jgi:hypothetical protein
MFASLYFIICIPPLLILLATGIFRLPRWWLSVASLILVLFLSVLEIHSWYTEYEKEDWRGTTAYVISRAAEGDAIIFYSPDIGTGFDYYQNKTSSPAHLPDPVPYFDPAEYTGLNPVFDIPWEYAPGGKQPEPDKNLVQRLVQYDRVWLILSHDHFDNINMDRVSQSQMIQDSLQEKYGIPEEEEFKHIRVMLFALP